jgi:hypothetical protein
METGGKAMSSSTRPGAEVRAVWARAPHFVSARGPRPIGWSPGILLLLLISALSLSGCAPEDSDSDPVQSLSAPDRLGLEEFIGQLSETYSRGDYRGVESLIAGGTDHRVIELARKHILPKGPTRIVAHRIEPYPVPEGPVFTLDGVDYELTVEPVGKLIFDVHDVSIGMTEVGMLIGKKDGVFRIAGYRPIR